MSAQDLSFSELLDATRGWSAEPAGPFLAASPVSALFMVPFGRLRAMIAGASSGSSEVAQLTDELGFVDADHDEVVRFIVAYFAAFAHDDEEAVAALAARLSTTVIPAGASLVRFSYADQAGRVAPRAAALTPDVRADLAQFALPPSRTLADKVDQLQALATEMGELLDRRRALVGDGAGPSGMELLNARRELIALIEQVLQNARMLGGELDEAARAQFAALEGSWRTAVSAATARAAARRRARAAKKPEPTDPV